MIETVQQWMSEAFTLEVFVVAVKWFVAAVGVCFVYYVTYSLRRLRRNLHHIANSLQLLFGQDDLRRDADDAPRSSARNPPA